MAGAGGADDAAGELIGGARVGATTGYVLGAVALAGALTTLGLAGRGRLPWGSARQPDLEGGDIDLSAHLANLGDCMARDDDDDETIGGPLSGRRRVSSAAAAASAAAAGAAARRAAAPKADDDTAYHDLSTPRGG